MPKVKGKCASWTFKVRVRSLTPDLWPKEVIELSATVTDGSAAVSDKLKMTRMATKESAVVKYHGRRPGAVTLKATLKDKGWKQVGTTVVNVPGGGGIVYVDVKTFFYDLQNVKTPVHIAPGKDPDFRIEYDVDDAGALVESGNIEIVRKKDKKVLRKIALKAAQLKAGHHAVAWDGAIDPNKPDFPDDFITIEHSPYIARVTIDGCHGKKTGEAETKVEISKFVVELAPKTCLTEDKDKAVYDQMPALPANALVKVKLKSNVFKVDGAEYQDSTAYNEYEKLWGAGPRIPLIARLTIFNSKEADVCAGKAMGRARVLWDFADPVESRTTYMAVAYSPPPDDKSSWGAKPFIDRALAYQKKTTRPADGDNAHADRGGKRRSAAGGDPVLAPKDDKVTAFPYTIAAGAKRWWAALSPFQKSGDEEAQAGVVFRPSRMAGDNYTLKAYLDLEEKLDVEDETPQGAAKEAAIGTFEVWREFTLAKRYKKCAAITGVMPGITSQYEDAYTHVDDVAGAPVVLTKGEYDTLFTAASGAATGHPAIKKYALEPLPSQYGAPETTWVATFRAYDAFKTAVLTGESWDEPTLGSYLTAEGLATQETYFEAIKSYAKMMGEHMCQALIKDDGLTVLQFHWTNNFEQHLSDTLNGRACGKERTKCGFALYQTEPSTAETPAHEIGHDLFLPHSPRIKSGAVMLSGGGITPKRHDGRNRNCLMSYARPRAGFCGLCLLRLRGWNPDQFNENGPITPALTAMNPAKGEPGTTVDVTLDGTGFVDSATTVLVSDAGITVSDVVIVSATKLTAKFALAADAATSPIHVSVNTPTGETGSLEFHLKPVLTKVEPAELANKPQAKLHVKLTGKYLVTGSKASLSGANLTVKESDHQLGTEMRALLEVGAGAATGDRKVKVTTPGGETNELDFTLAPLHTLTSVTPEKWVQGTVVDAELIGTDFLPGATVKLVGSSGITISNVVITATKITATFTLAANAKLGDVEVGVVSALILSEKKKVRVIPPPPTLTDITPAGSVGGKEIDVVLTGTEFKAVKTVHISGAGVRLAGGKVDSATKMSPKFDIQATAAGGPRDVKVETEGGTTEAKPFEVQIPPAPTLTALNPNHSFGGKAIEVVLTGTNFEAVQEIVASGAGVTCAGFRVDSPTQITAGFEIEATAAGGDREIKVKTSGGITDAGTFKVDIPPKPTLTSLNPPNELPGYKFKVELTGTNFEAVQGVEIAGAHVAVTGGDVKSVTLIEAEFDIDVDAAEGDHDVTVKTAGGTTDPVPFKVDLPPAPDLTNIAPPDGELDLEVDVTLTGSEFHAVKSVDVGGAGVTVTKWDDVSDTEITATFKIADDADEGDHDVTVTTRGGTSPAVPFRVDLPPVPRVDSIAPDTSDVDQEVDVIITGEYFVAVQSVDIDGADVTLVNANVDSETQISAKFAVDAAAAAGDRNVGVTTRSGTSGTVPFTVNPAPPTPSLTGIAPATGAAGTDVVVVLTGKDLTNVRDINHGPDIAMAAGGIDSDTQMTLTLSIDAGCAKGPRDITVAVPGSVSNPVTFTVT
jgi:hypothetical protein